MAFENIDCVKPVTSKAAIPDDGVGITARRLGTRGGRMCEYIKVQIGTRLAKAIALTAEEHRLRLLFGTDADAGKIMVSVDNEAGKFLAKRDKTGRYTLTINAATAEGLFALQFPPFTRPGIEALHPANGKPPHFVFTASPEMLALED